MNKILKNLNNIANLHDLRSISRTRRSAKPQLPTTAILELNMARNERDHLVKERLRLLKRKTQVDRRLSEIEKDMDCLLGQAQKKATEIRGKSDVPIEACAAGRHGHRREMVIEY